ncbi:DUF3152 domain-containing protein [Blastococcus xanthinilyticus]|uniref:LGFP repeat-containing protein n=1 Tax=Blastococcus xanthinilyticus TaxID=1564164 RepID=A0A5S5CTG2_9ACTN|nr:DUF3152 domain-containing protein [Blastococcus xanthinilyticus]TYP86404.1 LGFP repeat-containing protein [Blastococcus xanthinilyticus]
MSRAARLLLTVLVTLAAVAVFPSTASAAERTVTYTVSTRGAVAGDLGHFTAIAREVLTDPRGWSLGGTVAFEQVGSGSDFDLILAAPSVIAAASPGCSAQWSCRVGRSVYINDERWRFGTSSWPHGLAAYQRYVIQHEVGHWVGIPHTDCPSAGRTAWVMQQQSISLQGCLANVYPVLEERAAAGQRLGVSVAWSPVEQQYRALGGPGGFMGPPITWEHPTAGVGRYQSYAGGYGGGGIYWHPSLGAHEVYGDIYERWGALGAEHGVMGFPLTGERATEGVGRYQSFAGWWGVGGIYWRADLGAHEVYGDIYKRWSALDAEHGVLGFPLTGERATVGQGRYQTFTGRFGESGIYWRPDLGAHEVYGAIYRRWASLGAEHGVLGYPVSGEYDVDGGRRSDFEGGYIRWDRATNTTEVVTGG